MKRALLLATLLLVGCASSAPPPRTDIGDAHLTAPEARPAQPQRETSLDLRDPQPVKPDETAWPPLITGLDLQGDQMQGLMRAAGGPGFTARIEAGLDLPTLVAAVLTRHPAIAAARAQVRAVETEHTELDALLRVRGQYRAFTDELDPGVSARLPQTSGPDAYPLPGTEGLRARLIDQAAAIARASLHSTARQLVRDALATFARVRFQQERIQILRDQLALAGSLLQVMKSRFETGNADLGSVLALQERVARITDARADAGRFLASEHAKLGQLMAIGNAPVGPLTAPAADLLAMDPAETSDERLAHHPDARVLELKHERVGTMVELVEAMARPDTDLDLSELPNPLADRPAFREQPAAMPPGPWYGLMEARRAELAHRAAALDAARAALIDQLRARAVAAGQDLDSGRAELQLQQTTLDGLARQAVDATTEAFRTGRVDVDRVLAALTQQLDSALGASIARRDIATAIAESDYLLGPR